MRPSISVSLEPGLERGVPWGRDLYTFVTSAAGHMMRTLQKPRKNRPSKRQVNHRRFLHNMIQRKFADIEAANHRLASALHLKEEEKKSQTLEQSGSPSRGGDPRDTEKCSVHTGADDVSELRGDDFIGSHETEISEKKQPDPGNLWKRYAKTQAATCTTRETNHSKGGQKKESGHHKLVEFTSVTSHIDYTEYYDDESHSKLANNLSNDSQTSQQDSDFTQFGQNVDISPVFSPDLSPLSLDSCDLSTQTFTDTYTQAQKNIADISESQWTDIMDLFTISNKDLAGCMDVEAYFKSICACQGDTGQEGGADDVGFADQSDGFTERICSNRPEDLHFEAAECRYEYVNRFSGDQGLTINHFQSSLRPDEETHSQGIVQNQLPTSIDYQYDTSDLQTYQHPTCMLVNTQNITPFEGVAQSFSVPLHSPEQRPIPTLPHEDDWLFTDILKDRKSSDC